LVAWSRRFAAPLIGHDIVTSRPGVPRQTTTYCETARPTFEGRSRTNEPGTCTVEFQDMVTNRIESAPFVAGPPRHSTVHGHRDPRCSHRRVSARLFLLLALVIGLIVLIAFRR
jgi:hypothetical protein